MATRRNYTTIGYQGENRWDTITISIADLVKKYPGGYAYLYVVRAGDDEGYIPRNVEQTENALLWTPDDYDTEYDGILKAQAMYVVNGDVVGKTQIFIFNIDQSLTSFATRPATYEDWVNGLLQAATNVNSEIDAAEATLDGAVEAARAAQAAAEAAKTAAESAQHTAENAKASAVMSSNAAYNYAADANRAKRDAVTAKDNAVQAKGDAELAKTAAETAEDNANTSALQSEGYAVGTQDGVPAGEGEPYFHDNAKYYKELAEAAKTDAIAAKERAEEVVDGIEDAGNEQVERVTQTGSAQVQAVTAEGTTQVGNVQTKGQQVLNSIPADYTQLSENVDELKSTITKLENIVIFKVEINALNTVIPFIVNSGDSVTIRAKDGSALTVRQIRLVRENGTNDYWSVSGLISRTITVNENFVGVFVHDGTAQDVIVEKSGSPLDFQPQIDAINTQIDSYGESDTITPENVNTGYIHRDGRVMTSATFRYTNPIFVERGTIIFKALGYSNNVSLLALCDANGENRVSLVTSTPDAGTESVNYRIPYPMYVIISSQQSVPIQYTIIKDNSLIPEMISLSLFTHFGVIGDSYASGNIYYGNTYKTDYAHSWGQLIAKKFGTTCTNYSKGGLSTRTWLTDSKGLPLVLSSDPEDVYYLALGINDAWSLGIDYLGSLSDITSHSSYQDYPDTFYGNYGKIIEQIIAHAPHAKLMIFTLAQTGEPNPQFSLAIQEIAEHYKIPCAIELDDVFFTSPLFREFLIGGHPSGLGYGGMATAMERLIINTIVSNAAYFNDIYGYDD